MKDLITETAYYSRIGISREKLLELCKQKILS